MNPDPIQKTTKFRTPLDELTEELTVDKGGSKKERVCTKK
jgi:hypothetical protein